MVVEALEATSESEAMEMKGALESNGEMEFNVCTLGKVVKITKNMVSISKEKKKEHHRVFTPKKEHHRVFTPLVIEPSFGIGRIIYCLFEHSFYMSPSKGGDEQLNVFIFPPLVAPIKCTVYPLVQNQQYEEVAMGFLMAHCFIVSHAECIDVAMVFLYLSSSHTQIQAHVVLLMFHFII